MCFQFDDVLVMLSAYYFDERMFADWGQWNKEFKVNAVVGIAAMLAVNYRIGILCKSLWGVQSVAIIPLHRAQALNAELAREKKTQRYHLAVV